MLTNLNQLSRNDLTNENPETSNLSEVSADPRNDSSYYGYVDPELYNRWYQETQQQTPLDRKLLTIFHFLDWLEGRDTEVDKMEARTNQWLNHWKRKLLFFAILPTLVAVSGIYFFPTVFFRKLRK